MIAPYTENQKVRIVNNIVAACTDAEKLRKPAYKFISLANGFIAHYGIWGFIDHYTPQGKLKEAILQNQAANQWNNFHPRDDLYEYMMSKKDIYNRICERL